MRSRSLPLARIVAAPTARDEAKKQASKLVEDAAVAEAGGDIDNSTDLLHAAIKSDRNNSLAHWRLGELQANKQWVRVEDAQKQAASDRRLPEYQDLRAKSRDTLEDQLALAKWCRKAGLFDEARFHWANVLAADPNNADALIAALGCPLDRRPTDDDGTNCGRQESEIEFVSGAVSGQYCEMAPGFGWPQ